MPLALTGRNNEGVTTDEHDVAAHVRAVLSGLQTPWEIIPCDPALADTAEFCAHYGYALEDSANTIMVVAKVDPPRYAACVVLATTRLDVNRSVRTRFGVKKASFADAAVVAELTRMTLGGVTAIGLPAEVPLWVDAAVMARARIVLGGGSRDGKVLCPPSLLLELPNVEVVEGLAGPVPPRVG